MAETIMRVTKPEELPPPSATVELRGQAVEQLQDIEVSSAVRVVIVGEVVSIEQHEDPQTGTLGRLILTVNRCALEEVNSAVEEIMDDN